MRIAGAPISWGVCEVPGWGHQMAPARVLAEMRDLGLAATELGPDGFLPAARDEREALLDSGGGIQHARRLLGDDPIMLANIDSLWPERGTPALETLQAAWDPARMDLLLLQVARGNGIGFEGPQGFFMDAEGRLTHSVAEDVVTPYANVGFGIMKPQVLDASPRTGPFKIQPVWHRLQAEGRLYGSVMDAFWMHVGDPAARDEAEARLP